MISKSQLKFLTSLQVKKYRKIHQSFLVEGAKSIQELLQSDYIVQKVFTTDEFYQTTIRLFDNQCFDIEIVDQKSLEAAGAFQTNNSCLAVAKTKENSKLYARHDEFVLVLDEVKDPGNLGTIIRIADWYGISKIVCSPETADFYNPKVIAASMGSFTRVAMYYGDLVEYLGSQRERAIYGAFLDGTSIHKTQFAASGYIVMGNESNGISAELAPLIPQHITIPRFGGAESLNVGIATAIICDNMRRVSGT